jgi:hypothetical protein
VAWYNRLVAQMNDDDFPQELFGPYSKLKAHCARFALIIHLLRVACGEAGTDQSEGDIEAEDVAGAERLCAYFQGHFGAVYLRLQQTREDQKVEALVKWMRRKHLRRCTPRDLCRANVAGIKKASEAEKLLKAAADQGLGDLESANNAGNQRKKAAEGQSFVLKGE